MTAQIKISDDQQGEKIKDNVLMESQNLDSRSYSATHYPQNLFFIYMQFFGGCTIVSV